MSSNTYPKYGCVFCRSVDATKEQHKVHLDKHLPPVCHTKGTALLPSGNHFLPLLCAVRRRSVRKGLNKTILLPSSRFDVCRDWRLFTILKSDAELAAFFERPLHSRGEWEQLASDFVAEMGDDEDEWPVSDRATWDNYVPMWPVREMADAKMAGHGNANRNVNTTAQVQSAFGSPVKAKNGKFNVTVGGNKKSNTVRTLFDNGGEGSSRGLGAENKRAAEDDGDAGPSRKTRASDAEKAMRKAKPLPEIVDLTTPVKDEVPVPKRTAYDIWTPPKARPTMTLTVKGVGIFEVAALTTLAEFVNEIQHRVGGTVVALKVKSGRPVDETMWNAREGPAMTVAVEWDWSESE